MKREWMRKGWRGLAMALVAGALAACGGGGSGGSEARPAGQSGTAPTVRFGTETIDVSAIEGTQGVSEGILTFSFNPDRPAMFWMEEPKDYIVGGDANQIDVDRFSVRFVLSDQLAPGEYETEVIVRSCESDAAFEACLPGAPEGVTRVPLRYTVKPNIHVREAVALQRTGREPAPSQTLDVTIPADAGTVTASLATSRPDVLQAELVGGRLTISTVQARAGEYTGTVVLQGSADAAYRRSVQVSYTVLPPPGGEHDLQVDRPVVSAELTQGQTTSARFRISRATWTARMDPPQLIGPAGVFSFRHLGNDVYEITANTANIPTGSLGGTLRFNDGTPAGNVDAQLHIHLYNAFRVDNHGVFIFDLNMTSTEAALVQSAPVLTVDGVPARWTATPTVPWVTLDRASGVTGTDPLVVRIDKQAALNAFALDGAVTVALDRPGTTPIETKVNVRSRMPRVTRILSGPLIGSGGRIYVDGGFSDGNVEERLSVTGARVTAMSWIQDTRMLSETTLLVLDVDQATPGQAIAVSLTTPLLKTQVQTPVIAQDAVPEAYLALPYGRHRPPHYNAASRSLYFATDNRVVRWAHDGSAWTLSGNTVAGLVDVAPATEGDQLYGVAGRHVVKLDPATLAETSRGPLYSDDRGPSWREFDATAPLGMRALAFAEDGRAFASLIQQGQSVGLGDRGVSGLRGAWPGLAEPRDLSRSPVEDEPGNRLRSVPSAPDVGAGIVRSANGRTVMALDPDGVLWRYQLRNRQWSEPVRLPVGTGLVAVDDDGKVLISPDGTVRDGDGVLKARLTALLPDWHVAGGYGVTGDGTVALIYGYRITVENGRQRARDAGVWLVDLRGLGTAAAGAFTPRAIGHIPLPDAVGCTTATSNGEACPHQASVTVSPSSLSAFVLGPRGIASVRLASMVAATAAADATAMANGAASSRAQPASSTARRGVTGGVVKRIGGKLAPRAPAPR